MSEGQIHVGDYGPENSLEFDISDGDTPANLSTAVTKTLKIVRSDGSIVGPVAVSFVTDGTDGKVYWSPVAGTYTVPGLYQFQITVTTATGRNYSDVQPRFVWPNA